MLRRHSRKPPLVAGFAAKAALVSQVHPILRARCVMSRPSRETHAAGALPFAQPPPTQSARSFARMTAELRGLTAAVWAIASPKLGSGLILAARIR
jgi:hypothetical protein